MALFKSQPGKAIWVLLAVFANLVRFPWLFIYYIPSSTRPHPGWSWQQAVRVQVIKTVLWHMAYVNMKTPLSLKPRGEKKRFTVAQPGKASYYVGPAVLDSEIKPVPLGGTWYPAAAKIQKPTGHVVLHFHGGAFMIGDGRTADAGFAAKTLLANTAATAVYAPQYRLSGNPLGRFPAALQDAITAYIYLTQEEGIAPEKIIVSGDSAGGNMTLALVRYITEHGSQIGLQLPLCAWIWSPWVSPNRSMTPDAFESSPNAKSDYISAAFGFWGAMAYHPSPKTGATLDHPYICFYNNVFPTPVPLFVSTGECEVLLHDDIKLAEELKAVKGNKVRLQIEERSVHDIILTGKLMGFEKEAARAARRADEFLKSVIDGSPI